MGIYEDDKAADNLIDSRIRERAEAIKRKNSDVKNLDVASYLRDEGWKQYDIKRALQI